MTQERQESLPVTQTDVTEAAESADESICTDVIWRKMRLEDWKEFAALLAVLLTLGYCLAWELKRATMLSILQYGSISFLGAAVVWGTLCAQLLIVSVALIKTRAYPAHEPGCKNRILAKKRRRKRWRTAGALLCMAVMLATLLLDLHEINNEMYCSVPEYQDTLPFPLLTEMQINLADDTTVINEVDGQNMILEKRNLLASKVLEMRQKGENGEWLKIRYYQTKAPWISRRLQNDLCAEVQELHNCILNPVEVAGTDAAFVGTTASMLYTQHFLLLTRGRQVELVSFCGDRTLIEYADLFVQHLNTQNTAG